MPISHVAPSRGGLDAEKIMFSVEAAHSSAGYQLLCWVSSMPLRAMVQDHDGMPCNVCRVM